MKTLLASLLAPSNLSGLGGQPISKAAWAALTAVLLNGIVFVAVVVSYAGVAPLPWVDEVSYADPFLNFASGRGYTSGAWDSQPYGAAWASNSPLYGLLAMPALSLFGPSIEVWRGFWGVVFGASVLLILGSAWALGLIRTGLALLLAGLSLQFPYSMALLTTSGRGVDATCFLVLAALMGVLAFLRGSARVAGVFACGVLVPVAGLQLIPVIACAGLCFAFVDWRKSLCVCSWLALGAVVGLCAMLAAFAVMGVAHVYLGKTVGHAGFTSVGAVAQAVILDDAQQLLRENRYDLGHALQNVFNRDPAALVASVAVVCCLVLSALLRSPSVVRKTGQVLGFIGLLGIPAALVAAGRFEFYYYWMAFVPLVLCLGLYASCADPRALKWFALASLLCVAVVAMARGWIPKIQQEREQNTAVVEAIRELVRANVRAGDVIFTDEIAYFEARRHADQVRTDQYSGSRLFRSIPRSEQDTYTLAFVSDLEKLKVFGSKLEGDWREVDCVYVSEPGGYGAIGDTYIRVYRQELP
jgi:hypothetical protein